MVKVKKKMGKYVKNHECHVIWTRAQAKKRKLNRIINIRVVDGSARASATSLNSCDLESEIIIQDDGVGNEVSSRNGGSRRERRGMTKFSSSEVQAGSGKMESAKKIESEKSRNITLPAKKMPSDEELEKFFGDAEKEIQKRFIEKYNYDIVNDVPLEGRYEWVPLKPSSKI